MTTAAENNGEGLPETTADEVGERAVGQPRLGRHGCEGASERWAWVWA